MRIRFFYKCLLSIVSGTLLVMAISANACAKGMEDEILELINEYRASQSLPPFEMAQEIAEVAEGHSKEMAKGKVGFGHDGFDERVSKIRSKFGGTSAAENVAYGSRTAKEVVDMWLHSKGHKKNIISGKYKFTGIGIARSKDGTLYFTQIFIGFN